MEGLKRSVVEGKPVGLATSPLAYMVILFTSVKGMFNIFIGEIAVDGQTVAIPDVLPLEWLFGASLVILPILLMLALYKKKVKTSSRTGYVLALIWFFLAAKFFLVGFWSEGVLCFLTSLYYLYFVVALTLHRLWGPPLDTDRPGV